jgi:hypothetical protein
VLRVSKGVDVKGGEGWGTYSYAGMTLVYLNEAIIHTAYCKECDAS